MRLAYETKYEPLKNRRVYHIAVPADLFIEAAHVADDETFTNIARQTDGTFTLTPCSKKARV